MVTTRRSVEQVSVYDNGSVQGGVQLLERPVAQVAPAKTQDANKERMQRNLAKLMNYDKFSEQAAEEEKAEVVEEVVAMEASLSDEDIRPTSTTMQFGEDIDQIREEMLKAEEKEDVGYQLNGRGKVVAILYSLAITIILALIVLNTGVLASLSRESATKTAQLNNAVAKYNSIQTQIDTVSSDEYVIGKAESMGMVKSN